MYGIYIIIYIYGIFTVIYLHLASESTKCRYISIHGWHGMAFVRFAGVFFQRLRSHRIWGIYFFPTTRRKSKCWVGKLRV